MEIRTVTTTTTFLQKTATTADIYICKQLIRQKKRQEQCYQTDLDGWIDGWMVGWLVGNSSI